MPHTAAASPAPAAQRASAAQPASAAAAPPRAIRAVGVVGAGLMASQLATLFAQQLLVPVTMSDLSAERVEAARAGIRARLPAGPTAPCTTPSARCDW